MSVASPSVADMARPRVTVYNEMSIDGKITGFAGDGVRYYRRGFRWRSDAILMGSATAQSFGPAETPDQQAGAGPEVDKVPVFPGFEDLVYEPRPMLVIPDSSGVVRNWRHAQAQPWYGAMVALVSRRTPPEYTAYLERRGVGHLTAGAEHVDLAAALEQLADRYGVTSIRTDGGGALTGALLATGLVDEIALIVTPRVAGEPDATSLVRLPQAIDDSGVPLRLTEVETLEDGALWLRYGTGA